jgi:FAD-linked oxidoreductase
VNPLWRNWSRSASCRPARVVRPRTEAGIVAAVRAAGEAGFGVRAAGTGHSFNAIACTDEVLVDLTDYRGVHVDPDARTVTARAGTPLWTVCVELDRVGLALANIGTLASQTVAGAISTGNHGTGIGHGPFATQVTELRLVTAGGSVRTLSAESNVDVFRCARTSLGALGIISTVTLRCVPQFALRATRHREPLEAILDGVTEWATSADHVTLAWHPWREDVSVTSLGITDEVPAGLDRFRRYRTTLSEVRAGLAALASRPELFPLRKNGSTAEESFVDSSHRVFTFPQPVRFLAGEHALPLPTLPEALRTLAGELRERRVRSAYPIIVRVGAGDDTPLSPAYGRETGYVNLTVPHGYEHQATLRIAERVLEEFGGRPHWAKLHTATAGTLAVRYPEWQLFQRIRARLDPGGMFTSEYLARLLGPLRQLERVA